MKPRKSKICPTHAAEISGDSDHHRQYIGMHSREERRFWNLLMCHASVWISVVLWLVKIRSRKSGNLKGPARAWDFFKGGQWVDNLNTPVSTILCRTPIFFYIKHNSHLVTYEKLWPWLTAASHHSCSHQPVATSENTSTYPTNSESFSRSTERLQKPCLGWREIIIKSHASDLHDMSDLLTNSTWVGLGRIKLPPLSR